MVTSCFGWLGWRKGCRTIVLSQEVYAFIEDVRYVCLKQIILCQKIRFNKTILEDYGINVQVSNRAGVYCRSPEKGLQSGGGHLRPANSQKSPKEWIRQEERRGTDVGVQGKAGALEVSPHFPFASSVAWAIWRIFLSPSFFLFIVEIVIALASYNYCES